MHEAMQLNIHHHFEAAHSLPNHPGKCCYLHGHRWEVDVEVRPEGSIQLEDGMLIDFGDIKAVIDELDHKHLNMMMENPTAEIIAMWIANGIVRLLPPDRPWTVVVQLWESPECSVTYALSWGLVEQLGAQQEETNA